MSGQPTGGPHASLAEEAGRLVGALQGLLASYAGGAGGQGDDTWARATADPTVGSGESPECAVCPFCRSMRFLRTVRPESVEPLVGAASALAAALQEMMGQAQTARASRPDPPPHADTWD